MFKRVKNKAKDKVHLNKPDSDVVKVEPSESSDVKTKKSKKEKKAAVKDEQTRGRRAANVIMGISKVLSFIVLGFMATRLGKIR